MNILGWAVLLAPVVSPVRNRPWTQTPTAGIETAVVSGDPKTGASRSFKRFTGGLEIPPHKHTHDLHRVIVSGTLNLIVEGEIGRELEPGSYAFIPAGTPHSAICKRPGPCVVFDEQPGAADFIPLEGTVPTAVATTRPTPPPAARPRGPAAITPAARRSHEQRQAAADLLFKRFPEANWNTEPYLAADITGDGEDELILVGRGGSDVFIGVVPPKFDATSRAWFVRLGVAADKQDALCDSKVTLTAEQPASPAVTAKGARGVRIDDGKCDAFHLFWDPAGEKLRWWRR